MAGLGMIIGSAVINAVAFTGSGFLFSKLNGGDGERKRHDLAMEKFTNDRDEWNRERYRKVEMMNKEFRDHGLAEKRFKSLEGAMEEYFKITGRSLDIPKAPLFSDYFENGDGSKHYTELGNIVVIMILGFGGAVLYEKFYGKKYK